jgi:putative transposase
MSRIERVDARVRLAIVQWPPDAPRGAITTFCAEHGISRETFYAIRKRAAMDGPAAALEPRSRRPSVSPSRVADEVVQRAIGVRAALEQTPLARLAALSNRSLRALRCLRPLSIFVPERQEKRSGQDSTTAPTWSHRPGKPIDTDP